MTKTFLFKLICLLLLNHSTAWADNWMQQRWAFKQAYQAILTPDEPAFSQYLAELETANYPITHYLHYLHLKSNLDQMEVLQDFLQRLRHLHRSDLDQTDALQDFLYRYQGTPLVDSLRKAGLIHLAQQKDWPTFLAIYTPQTDTILQCYYRQAQFETAQASAETFTAAKALWLVGKSQPDECDALFTHLYQKDWITDEMRWQRTHLALQNGKMGLARFLAKDLPKIQQTWVTQWRALHDDPAKALALFNPPAEGGLAKAMLHYGLKRLARKDAALAFEKLTQYQKVYQLTEDQAGLETFRYLALYAADQRLPEAKTWLAKIDETVVDEKVKQARLQVALAQLDWPAVLALTDEQTTDDLKWRYWRARALEQTEQVTQAHEIFTQLAKARHYYGFSAAERLQHPYSFNAVSVRVPKAVLTKLSKNPRLIRARELFLVGLTDFARTEWQILLETLSPESLQGAAVLAQQWGWHDRAIVTAAKAKVYDDLILRFPTPFYDSVSTQATDKQLDAAWVYAIIRQESAFQTDARSRSNALGLMQLLPSTAKEVATKLKLTLRDEAEILKPETNIHLGTGYLRYLLDRFEQNRLLATVGYNAGPSHAKRWAKQQCVPTDVWIELIPFSQTRDYVKRVMSYAAIFEFRWVNNAQVVSMPIDEITACAQ